MLFFSHMLNLTYYSLSIFGRYGNVFFFQSCYITILNTYSSVFSTISLWEFLPQVQIYAKCNDILQCITSQKDFNSGLDQMIWLRCVSTKFKSSWFIFNLLVWCNEITHLDLPSMRGNSLIYTFIHFYLPVPWESTYILYIYIFFDLWNVLIFLSGSLRLFAKHVWVLWLEGEYGWDEMRCINKPQSRIIRCIIGLDFLPINKGLPFCLTHRYPTLPSSF